MFVVKKVLECQKGLFSEARETFPHNDEEKSGKAATLVRLVETKQKASKSAKQHLCLSLGRLQAAGVTTVALSQINTYLGAQ